MSYCSQKCRNSQCLTRRIRDDGKTYRCNGGKQSVVYDCLNKFVIYHKALTPVIKSVIDKPIAIQIMSKQALINREVPANTCPSIRSIIEFINGTPGIR